MIKRGFSEIIIKLSGNMVGKSEQTANRLDAVNEISKLYGVGESIANSQCRQQSSFVLRML